MIKSFRGPTDNCAKMGKFRHLRAGEQSSLYHRLTFPPELMDLGETRLHGQSVNQVQRVSQHGPLHESTEGGCAGIVSARLRLGQRLVSFTGECQPTLVRAGMARAD